MAQRHLSAVPPGDETSPGAPADAAAVLLQKVALGESAAFETLYDLYSSRVYGLALTVVRDPHQAQEVAQEAFLDVWRRASRFDAGKGSATAWIMSITHGRAVDRVRSAQAAADREVRDGMTSPVRDIDVVAEAVDRRLDQAAVQRCLSTLTDLQRQSVTLAYYSGYTYPQVAALLQAAVPTVKTRIRDGLIRLRDCLGVSR